MTVSNNATFRLKEAAAFPVLNIAGVDARCIGAVPSAFSIAEENLKLSQVPVVQDIGPPLRFT